MAVNKDGVYIAEDKDFQYIDEYWIYKGVPLEIDITDFVNNKNLTSIRNMFRGLSYGSTAVKRVVLGKNSVTDMSYMFRDSQATSLDLSSFDTSSVTTMYFMFRSSQATSLDLSSFDTSSVTNMNSMFSYSQATSLDLSSFDTSRVTFMNSMFNGSQATTGCARTQADANKFNSSSNKPEGLVFVVDKFKDGVYIAEDKDFRYIDGYWIYKGEPLEVDITDFVNNKKLASIRYMFSGSSRYGSTAVKKVVLGKNSVTDMNGMFWSSKATSLDLSSFDASSVTKMYYTFDESKARTGYARTQADANKFNSSSDKPAGLFFVVGKPPSSFGRLNNHKIKSMLHKDSNGMIKQVKTLKYKDNLGNITKLK